MPEVNFTGAIAAFRPAGLREVEIANDCARAAVIVFVSPENAERLVAGTPAVARAVCEVALTGMEECVVITGVDWQPHPRVAREIERLANGVHVVLARAPAEQLAPVRAGAMTVCGEQLCVAGHSRAWEMLQSGSQGSFDVGRSQGRSELRSAERRILLATAKAGDGLVSRMLNRPVSRLISGLLLRLPWVRPIHATLGTAALGVAMFVALTAGGAQGLMIGAFLFQAASIFDGVDGEIARATFRVSRQGAMLDSVVDVVTNITFIGGVAANLWSSGSGQAAAIGTAGLAFMSLGLSLLGIEARRNGGPFAFDLVKHHVGRRPSQLRKWLIWLTMRDFYALAGFVFVASGHSGAGLVVFAVVAGAWLAVVCWVLARRGRGLQLSGPGA